MIKRDPKLSRRVTLPVRRKTLYAALVTVVVLATVNTVVELLESHDVVDTHRPDDSLYYVEGDLYERAGAEYLLSEYGTNTLTEGSFLADKPGWRMFVTGASFALGAPCTDAHGLRPEEVHPEGSIDSWMRTQLQARFPSTAIEVVSSCTQGMDSNRVKSVAEEVVGYDPDVLLVATGNNEGCLHPRVGQEFLLRQGGYRLLRKLLLPSSPADRSWYTDQHPDVVAIRDQYRANIRAIVDAATAQDVTVLLCTLPVRLDYRGRMPGRILSGEGTETSVSCPQGIAAYEQGSAAVALGLLDECLESSDDGAGAMLEMARTVRALARLESGAAGAGVAEDVSEALGPCVARGVVAYHEGRYAEAIDDLSACDEVADALLWIGLSRVASGDVDGGRQALEQSVELVPRNRCRPSFNRIIHEEAARSDRAFVVDLESRAKELSATGIPGTDLFHDYCHLWWWRYADMAEVALDVLEENGLLPDGQEDLAHLPARESRTLGLSEAELRQICWGLEVSGDVGR